MASGSKVGEGGSEGSKEKQRFVETKVYTRRVFKGSRKSDGAVTAVSSASPAVPPVAPVPVPVPDPTVAIPVENVVSTTTSSRNGTATCTSSPVNVTNANDFPGATLVGTTTAMVTPTTPPVHSALAPFVSDAVIPARSPVSIATGVSSPVVVTTGLTPWVDTDTGVTCPVYTATEAVTGVTPQVDTAIATSVRVEDNSDDLVGRAALPIPVDVPTTTVSSSFAARDTTTNDTAVIVTFSGNNAERESAYGHEIDRTQYLEPQVRFAVLGQHDLVSHLDAPDDLNSYHRHQDVNVRTRAQAVNTGNGERDRGMESRMKVNLALKSKQERRELRRKLGSELDEVRGLMRRIETAEVQHSFGGVSSLRFSVSDGVEAGMRRASLDYMPMGFPRESATPIGTPTPVQSRTFTQLSVSVMDNGQAIGEVMEKEKRTPKANPLYRNSEFLLAKDKFPPAETNKKSKSNGKRHGGETRVGFGPSTKIFKNCIALLDKLMKHKHGWVFNTPVDVEGLCLHDYYSIIKHPMDLGTVKSRLTKNWYKAPEEFAEDVRLTFHNALTYNPKGQDVHIMAELLLKIFEDKWAVIKSDYDREMRLSALYHMGVPTPPPRKAPPLSQLVPLDMRRILDRSESMTYPSFDSRPKKPIITTTPSGRTPAPKKPKAKDPNKRDMTYEEKQKLSTNLQNLPSEKLDNIVQIIKKRNSALSQHDDEIEVDIDSVDTETLWELDRFVTNYKKSLSKNKRKAELAMQARAKAEKNVQEKIPAPIVVEAPKENKTVTDERIVPAASPVQAEKQGDDGSRSSSSSSSSSDSESSSTDSDSDSSSASGSDLGH